MPAKNDTNRAFGPLALRAPGGATRFAVANVGTTTSWGAVDWGATGDFRYNDGTDSNKRSDLTGSRFLAMKLQNLDDTNAIEIALGDVTSDGTTGYLTHHRLAPGETIQFYNVDQMALRHKAGAGTPQLSVAVYWSELTE